MLNLETLRQINPFLIMLIRDLNDKSKNWFCHDKSSHKGNAIKNVRVQFGLQQIIKGPRHVSNTSSSCIDLIFTSQADLITDSGVHSSVHPNCHHQIVFAKLNFTYCISSTLFTRDLALQRNKHRAYKTFHPKI